MPNLERLGPLWGPLRAPRRGEGFPRSQKPFSVGVYGRAEADGQDLTQRTRTAPTWPPALGVSTPLALATRAPSIHPETAFGAPAATGATDTSARDPRPDALEALGLEMVAQLDLPPQSEADVGAAPDRRAQAASVDSWCIFDTLNCLACQIDDYLAR